MESAFENKLCGHTVWMFFVSTISTKSNPCCASIEPLGCFESVLFCRLIQHYPKNHSINFELCFEWPIQYICSLRTSCSSCRGFFWIVMKYKNWNSAFSKLNRFWVESVIKTYLDQCFMLASPYMAMFPQSFSADRQNSSSTFTTVSVFRESTTARCQWLADRQPGWVCLPCSSVFSLFVLNPWNQCGGNNITEAV